MLSSGRCPDTRKGIAPKRLVDTSCRICAVQSEGTSRLKNIGTGLLFPLGLLIILFLAVLSIRGIVWASEKLVPILSIASFIAFGICLFVLLPLSIFRKARGFAGVCFVWASLLFGAFLFTYSCLSVVDIWGYGGLTVGLLLGGVGVIPLSFIAALFHAEWGVLLNVVVGVVLTFGTRTLGFWLTTPKEEYEPVLEEN
jgi:hypothetical protein